MTPSEIKEYLDLKLEQYRRPSFISDDPIQIPLRYTLPQDIEISGFLSAIISWGKRSSIISNADKILQLMDYSPYDFVLHHTESDLDIGKGSLHRTFMKEDLVFLLRQLQRLYASTASLESYFIPKEGEVNIMGGIERFREALLVEDHRAKKHISSPARNSAAKRLSMFLRWMVRNDEIDIGMWNKIPLSKLSIPLDVHTGRVARSLGLLNRKQDDRKAVEELDLALRKFDPLDPVKYDFALFGIGVHQEL